MSGWQVHDLMVAVGDLLDLPQVTELPDDDHWRLVTAGGDTVLVDYDRDTGLLYLATMLGRPHAEARLRIYEMLLLYNGAARDTGGGRMLLEEPGGEAVLQQETATAGLDATALSAMLANLQEVAGLWRRLIAAPPGEARNGGTDLSHFGHIRG